jgi:hypothetical protein
MQVFMFFFHACLYGFIYIQYHKDLWYLGIKPYDKPFNKYLNRKFYLHKYLIKEVDCEQQTGYHTNL